MKPRYLGLLSLVHLIFPLSAEAEPPSDWNLGKMMPTRRSEIAATVVREKIYVPGGVSLRGSLASFECYDPKQNRWEKLPRLPVTLNHVGVASQGSFLYISGGFIDLLQKKVSDRLYQYDTIQQTWTDLGAMPGARAKHYMIHRDGWLHLIGGLKSREIWSYHIRSRSWKTGQLPPLPELRDHISVLQDANSLYIVGGRQDREGERAACLEHREGSPGWRLLTYLPVPRGGQTATLHQGKIYVIGGEDMQTHETFRRLDVYDIRRQSWTEGPPMKRSRHGMASAQNTGKWYIIGGGHRSAAATVFSTTRRVEVLTLP